MGQFGYIYIKIKRLNQLGFREEEQEKGMKSLTQKLDKCLVGNIEKKNIYELWQIIEAQHNSFITNRKLWCIFMHNKTNSPLNPKQNKFYLVGAFPKFSLITTLHLFLYVYGRSIIKNL